MYLFTALNLIVSDMIRMLQDAVKSYKLTGVLFLFELMTMISYRILVSALFVSYMQQIVHTWQLIVLIQ